MVMKYWDKLVDETIDRTYEFDDMGLGLSLREKDCMDSRFLSIATGFHFTDEPIVFKPILPNPKPLPDNGTINFNRLVR